jgi:hypothetical protein
MLSSLRTGALVGLMLTAPFALADEDYLLTIKDHQFEPTTLTVPAGQKVKLTVKNLDPTPEEFESHELNREKIVPGGGTVSIFIGPLKAGEYPFFGEFHEDTAKGVIIAK